MERQKRVAAIHDISCFGKCSLTVALPIISAAGIETAVIPTAVLSTHTGGFTGYTYRDLTDDITPIFDHWNTLGLTFDAGYSGYLGSFDQLKMVSDIFDSMRAKGAKIFVDPVMADNGQLYASFDASFPSGMRTLCERADVIMPNITEAALLLGEDYVEGPYTRGYIEGLLKRLAEINGRTVVLTGVYFDDKELGAMSYDARTGKTDIALAQKIPGSYHGTGDVFGSALVATAVLGKEMKDALKTAVDFTVAAIARTSAAGTDMRYGVNFEQELGRLTGRLTS
jgi:pyridoxine kinase